ncbi:hypothetical protein DFH09DRAFT_1330396 [Mycena vulgaris]|nr:hypothetical protein DFH09DRAFT_1330396 [Mycena vulgaris]
MPVMSTFFHPPIHSDEEDTTSLPAPSLPAPSTPLRPAPAPAAAPLPQPLPSPPPPLSAARENRRPNATRRETRLAPPSDNPFLKSVHQKHIEEAKASALELNLNATTLLHSKPTWLGSRSAGEDNFAFTKPTAPHNLSAELGGISDTQEEVNTLSAMQGFMYIAWLRILTIPLLDSHHHIIALLGGMPHDLAAWKVVTNTTASLLKDHLTRLRLSKEHLHHHRAQDSFPAVVCSWSHGSGQTYTAGGVFRWVHNGFKTNEDWELLASQEDLAARAVESKGCWEKGMKMFSTIDDL